MLLGLMKQRHRPQKGFTHLELKGSSEKLLIDLIFVASPRQRADRQRTSPGFHQCRVGFRIVLQVWHNVWQVTQRDGNLPQCGGSEAKQACPRTEFHNRRR